MLVYMQSEPQYFRAVETHFNVLYKIELRTVLGVNDHEGSQH